MFEFKIVNPFKQYLSTFIRPKSSKDVINFLLQLQGGRKVICVTIPKINPNKLVV